MLPRTTYALVVVLRDGDEVTAWPLEGVGPPDVAVIDELARLQLRARRMGCSIRLRDVSAELFDLLDLLGLGDVVPCVPGLRGGGRLPVEVERQAEDPEEVGVEEAVMPDDPTV
ncbi:MAG: STAS domain-containing protein [Actinomycetota bacterium]